MRGNIVFDPQSWKIRHRLFDCSFIEAFIFLFRAPDSLPYSRYKKLPEPWILPLQDNGEPLLGLRRIGCKRRDEPFLHHIDSRDVEAPGKLIAGDEDMTDIDLLSPAHPPPVPDLLPSGNRDLHLQGFLHLPLSLLLQPRFLHKRQKDILQGKKVFHILKRVLYLRLRERPLQPVRRLVPLLASARGGLHSEVLLRKPPEIPRIAKHDGKHPDIIDIRDHSVIVPMDKGGIGLGIEPDLLHRR